jgi:hypothetical protein
VLVLAAILLVPRRLITPPARARRSTHPEMVTDIEPF